MIFALLWIVTFLMISSTSLVSPVIPYLVNEFVAGEAAAVALIGLLNSSFNLAKTLANIPGGVLADKIGRKELITASFLILPLSFLLYYLSDNYYYLIIGELISGIAMGFSVPAFSALIADIVPQASMSMAYGVFNLSWTLSQIPSPIIGGLLSDAFGMKFPFLIALAISLACLIVSLKIPERTSESTELPLPEEKLGEEGDPRINLKAYKRVVALFCGVEALNGLGNGVLTTLFVVYPMYVLNVSPFEMGLVFSIGWGVATALSQIPGGWLADKFGEKPLILACLIASAPLLILLSLTRSLIQFILVLGLVCVIGDLSTPAYSSWLAASVPSTKRGAGFGWTSAAFGTGLIIGPMIGSIAWNFFQPHAIISFTIAAAFFLLSIPLIRAISP